MTSLEFVEAANSLSTDSSTNNFKISSQAGVYLHKHFVHQHTLCRYSCYKRAGRQQLPSLPIRVLQRVTCH